MFTKRKDKILETQYGKLLNEYEEMFEKTPCISCDSYFDGNVKTNIERFKNCSNCLLDCEELKKVAVKMDEVLEQIENL